VEDDTDFEDSYIPDVFEPAHQALPSAQPIPAVVHDHVGFVMAYDALLDILC
jgi:3-phosphoglycerate kinase